MNEKKRQFFDINKLPKDYGILFFPISISRAENNNGQTPEQCFDYLSHFSPKKISAPKIGLNMIYGDFLYMHSRDSASSLKAKFMSIVLKHKNGFQKIIKKHWNELQIQHAFAFQVWNQLYLDYKDRDFALDFANIKKIYQQDEYFQKLVRDDAIFCNREINDEQLNFFLEEHLMFYLISKKRVSLSNEYVQGREQWILYCYPGVPLKGQIYLYQKNFFKLSAPENIYENCAYDLQSKLLVDLTKIDLDTYNYSWN